MKKNTSKHLDILRQNGGYNRGRNWTPTNGRLGEKREDGVDRATAYLDANAANAAKRWTSAVTSTTGTGKIAPAILPDWQLATDFGAGGFSSAYR